MKNLFVLIYILLSAKGAIAQQQPTSAQVPAEVTASLLKIFPEASGIEWTQKKGRYKAQFKVAKTKHEVWLEKTGTVSKHRYEIKKTELPKAVTDAIAKEFDTYTIHDCERTDSEGVTTYKVELKSAAGKKNVHFGLDGKMIPKNEDQ